MAPDLNVYRAPSRSLSILPCASLEGGCELHRLGRNQPCLQFAAIIRKPSESKATPSRSPKSPSNRSLLKRTPLSCFTRHQRSKAAGSTDLDANTIVPPLLTLPVELLKAISDLLTPASFTALTLTCSALFTALGTKPWQGLIKKSYPVAPEEEEYQTLLALLQRDQPFYRFCVSCGILHTPRHSTVPIPRNVLTRRDEPSPILRRTVLYYLEPGPWGTYSWIKEGNKRVVRPEMKDRTRRPAYWLSHAHIEAAVLRRICLATLSCKAKHAIPVTLAQSLPIPDGTSIVKATLHLEYKTELVHVRKHRLMCKTTFAFSFESASSLRPVPLTRATQATPLDPWQETCVKNVLTECTDMRPCVHAPENILVDEIVCCLFHGGLIGQHQWTVACERSYNEKNEGRGTAVGPFDPVGSHAAKQRQIRYDWYDNKICDCVWDFEMMVNGMLGEIDFTPNRTLEKMEVVIWNLFGEKPDERDPVLRQRGVLKGLWYDSLWDTDGRYQLSDGL